MNRFFTTLLIVLAFVLTGAVLLWYFSYGMRPVPEESALPGLAQPATVSWSELDVARIQASDMPDAYAALGYAHGMQRTWEVLLWRQTALGRLSEWFGAGVFDIDRHAFRLSFARQARQVYEHELTAEEKAILRAYTSGLNTALQTDQALRRDELVLLNLQPAVWEPWHTLAVERLIAWLATPPLLMPEAVPDSARVFAGRDRLLRRWLHLYGFDQSLAWAAQDSTGGPVFFQRYVHGASALPFLHDVVIDLEDGTRITGASLPGTPYLPAGRQGGRAWALMLGSTATLDYVPRDTSAELTRYNRLRTHEGTETLQTTRELADVLYLATTTTRIEPDTALFDSLLIEARGDTARVDTMLLYPKVRDSTWVVRWPGLQATNDVTAWQTLMASDTAAFDLWDGTGLTARADSNWTVLGTPAYQEPLPNGVLIGSTPWTRYQAQALRTHMAPDSARSVEDSTRRVRGTPMPVGDWMVSDSSTWAADMAPSYLSAIDTFAQQTPTLSEAETYVRNWNYVYSDASIGASIFDTWMRWHSWQIDALPTPTDSVYFAPHYRRLTFQRAVRWLHATYGPDLRQWRWERVNPDVRYFPVWAADSLVAFNLSRTARTRYAPVEQPGRGHASTLSGGSSLVRFTPPAPAAWDGWWYLDRPATMHVRRYRPSINNFLGRSLARDDRPAPVALDSATTRYQTRLVPADQEAPSGDSTEETP